MMIEGPGFSLYETAAQEDRSAKRIRVQIPAMLRPSGGRGFHTVLRDISLSGFSVNSLSRMRSGMVCWLSLPGLEALQSEVVWWEGGVVGCAFANLMSQIVLDSLLDRWPIQSDFRPVC
jgi:hypothetical protein